MKKIIILIFFICNITYAQWISTNGPSSYYVPRIFFDSADTYVVCGQGIYYSANDGDDWELINNKTINFYQEINDIIKKDKTIFIGTNKGVFKTDDFGNNWQQINNGFEKNTYYIIKLFNFNDNIWALNHRSLYKFNYENEEWEIVSDSLPIALKKDYSTIINYNGNLFLGMKIYEKSNPREPNIYISNDEGSTWIGVVDTISGFPDNNINCFAFKDSILIAGTNNGIYVSSDNGYHWSKKSNGLFVNNITSLHVIDDNIFAGTSMAALFCSVDNGDSWKLKMNGLSGTYILTINSKEKDIFVGTEKGLFKSTDYGEHWISKSSGLSGSFTWDIVKDKNMVYAGLHDQGVYISSDMGQNWDLISEKNKNNAIFKIVVKDSIIVASLYPPGGILQSNDYGATWNAIKNPVGLFNTRINCLVIYGDTIYAGTQQGLYFSLDYGKSWNSLNQELVYYNITSFKILFNQMFLGTYKSGIFISSDDGQTWINNSTSFTEISVRDFVANENEIFAATYNSPVDMNPIPWKGIFKSTDGGLTWFQVNTGLPENGINCLISINNNLIAGSDEEGVYLSTNSGESWSNISLGLINYHINKLIISDDLIYAATGNGVFKAKLSDFGIVNVEEQTEAKNYLYCYPPYPNPTTNIVRSLIYWDTSIDIENDDIAVYDIFGNKVAGKENITIDKQNTYSGLLTWDCSNVPDGIYLIRVVHGTKTRTMKVIVSK